MSTGVAPFRARKRKFVVRAKPSSGSGKQQSWRPAVSYGATTEGAASELRSNDEIQATPKKTASHKSEAELTSHSIPAVAESEREDNTRPFVEEATIINSEYDATLVDKSHSSAFTDSDVADIEKTLRRMLQVHGPCHLGELLKVLSPSQAQEALHEYGTLTAFIEQLQGFIIVHEDPYTFVYYEEPDGDDYDCGVSSNLQDEADAGASSTASDNVDRQHMVPDDCELRRARSSSSSSSCYESAVEEQHEEESHGVKDAACQVSSPCCHSRGVQAVHETSDAEAQTEELDISRFVELQSTPQSCDVDVEQMKERLQNLQQNQVGDVQQLKTEQVLKRPEAAAPQYVVQLKNCTATKEQKAADKNRASDEVSPPQPRLPLRQRNVPPRVKTENNLLMPAVEPRPWPLKQGGGSALSGSVAASDPPPPWCDATSAQHTEQSDHLPYVVDELACLPWKEE
ncbi:hypothetical protein MTO96_026806 [Rhipicephalus appendiculatus]